MGYKLSDIYLFSDFDGTLHSATEGIPQCNLDALQRFVQKGGHFGLATGRAPFSAKGFLHLLPINSPCLCVNGGAVYDMQKDEYIYTDFLPEQARDYIEKILSSYPELDTAVLTDQAYYYVADPELAAGRMKLQNYTVNPYMRQPMEGNWFKATFNCRGNDARRYTDLLNNRGWEGVRFTCSDSYFIEMLPVDTSKGNAIRKMCERLGINIDQTVAVGDYYNDIEMFEAAGFSACVAGAPEEIKQLVDKVLVSCEEGAVAQLIELLEAKYES